MLNSDPNYLKDLKAILYSKRANLYYLEKCRIMVKDGRVVYLTQVKDKYFYYNIPIANTTVLLLGTGTSITQAAVRFLASAGVMIGFTGSNGTPLFAGTEVEWISSKNEYRPTEYLQNWLSFWYNETDRTLAAKDFQKMRIDFIRKVYSKDKLFHENGFIDDDFEIQRILENYNQQISQANTVNEVLLKEANFTKNLYKISCKKIGLETFTRDRESNDVINSNLNHGNYLAYGLASVSLWALGIPPAFALFHGKTRRGALVFDVADLIKDAIVLPLSFCTAKYNFDDEIFRNECIKYFTDYKVLDYMFDSIKYVAKKYSKVF